MKKNKLNTMKQIITKDENTCILYEYKITKFEKLMKNKGKTINTNYSSVFPRELSEHIDVHERTIFFYKQNNTIYITSRMPSIEHQQINIQKTNQFSIPKSYFPDVEKHTHIRICLNLDQKDTYSNKNKITIHMI